MGEQIKHWKGLIPGEVCWQPPPYVLLHKALLADGSGITIWRTKALGYYSVEVWNGRDNEGPIWKGRRETFTFKRDWEEAERKYKELVMRHGGF